MFGNNKITWGLQKEIDHTHRIHGAAIYGAPWIPSIYPLYVSIYIPYMDPMGYIYISLSTINI